MGPKENVWLKLYALSANLNLLNHDLEVQENKNQLYSIITV